MRRADRLLQIVQILRRHKSPTTAQALADELEVAVRTVYRDVAALQALDVPILGEAGVGYVLQGGYDLPPLMFTADEMEAISLGAKMVMERGDALLALAATDVLAKVKAVLPKASSDQMWKAALIIPHPLESGLSFGEYLPQIRLATRNQQKMHLVYVDRENNRSERTIWPLGLYLFSHLTLVCAWCETRKDFRAFRSERIEACELLGANFDARNGALMAEFLGRFNAKT